jgi:hypothetical protein
MMSLRAFWTRRSHVALDEFAEGIRRELGAMPTPAADERLLARVLESRRRGIRAVLPVADPAPPRRIGSVIAAVAAAAAVVVAIGLTTRDPGAVSDVEGWFFGGHAYAQTRAVVPRYPGARVTRADHIRPLRLTYRSTVRTAGAVSTREIAWSSARESVDGVPAWRVVSVTRGPGATTQCDSVWVSAATFTPLRRAVVEKPYRRYGRIEVRQRFGPGGVRGEMNAFRGGVVAAHRTFERALPDDLAPYVTGALVPLYMAGVTIDRTWTGSLAVLGWCVRNDDLCTPVAMRVDGEDTLRLPTGPSDCWRVAIDFAGGRQWYWVRKSDGVGVRSLDSTEVRTRGVRETILVAE